MTLRLLLPVLLLLAGHAAAQESQPSHRRLVVLYGADGDWLVPRLHWIRVDQVVAEFREHGLELEFRRVDTPPRAVDLGPREDAPEYHVALRFLDTSRQDVDGDTETGTATMMAWERARVVHLLLDRARRRGELAARLFGVPPQTAARNLVTNAFRHELSHAAGRFRHELEEAEFPDDAELYRIQGDLHYGFPPIELAMTHLGSPSPAALGEEDRRWMEVLHARVPGAEEWLRDEMLPRLEEKGLDFFVERFRRWSLEVLPQPERYWDQVRGELEMSPTNRNSPST